MIAELIIVTNFA